DAWEDRAAAACPGMGPPCKAARLDHGMAVISNSSNGSAAPSAGRGPWGLCPVGRQPLLHPGSVHLQVGVADDGFPLLALSLGEAAEFVGGSTAGLITHGMQALAGLRHGQETLQGEVQLGNDGARGPLGSIEGIQCLLLEYGQAMFDKRRYSGQQ